MNRFILKFRELCILTTLLAVGGFCLAYGFFSSSSWDSVLSDIPADRFSAIEEVRFVAEYPLSEETKTGLLEKREVAAESFAVTVESSGIHGSTKSPFKDQVRDGFSDLGIGLPYDLSGKQYAFYVDIPRAEIERFTNAYLYYYLVFEPYRVYVDGKLLRSVASPRGDPGHVQILNESKGGTVRVLWICENTQKNRIRGFFLKNGVTVRSGVDLVKTVESSELNRYFPHVASAISLFIIALMAFGFAFSSKQYLDIWAFAAFTMAMSLFIWSQTEVFFGSWGWTDAGKTLSTVRGLLAVAVVVFSSVLTMAFFRLEGRHMRINDLMKYFRERSIWGIIKESTDILNHPFRMILLSTVVVSSAVLYQFWPMTFEGKGTGVIQINTRLAWVLLASQCLAFYFGYRSLFQIRSKLIKKGLEAQTKLINKRIATSLVFTLGMGIMVIAFLNGLKGVTNSLKSDIVLLAAIFPASAMLLMFFWMVSSANRFYQKFSTRLGQIDHEVLAFGEKALEKRYFGCLLVFDLKGMKKLNMVRSGSKSLEDAVDHLLSEVEHNLSDLIQKGRITFKYKSNGDEFIFNMRAKDEVEAQELMVELTTLWHSCAARYLEHWREGLRQDLSGHLADEKVDEIVSSIEMHVLITTLRDMKITIKGGIDQPSGHPDFIDPRFTQLTSLFKPTRHNKIAMFADDAAAVCEKIGAGVHFTEDHDSQGFLEFKEIDRIKEVS